MDWLAGFGSGLAAGVALMGLTALVFLLAGTHRLRTARSEGPPDPGARWKSAPVLMLAIVTGEELLFRSLLVGAASDHIGAGWAVGLSALAFALLHVPNGVPNPFTLLSLFLFSLLAGVLYLSHGLPYVVGLHFGLNLTQWNILGLPLYGQPVGRLLRLVPRGEGWLGGGSHGAESSLVATAVLGLASLVAVLTL